MRLSETPGAAIHRADCDIWETPPDAAPAALIDAGIDDDALIRYCGAVRPVYDALKRVLGQLSGVLLLMQTEADDPDWREPMLRSAMEQLQEARERLATVRPPRSAEPHCEKLGAIAAALARLLGEVGENALRLGRSKGEVDALVGKVFQVHRLLLAASEPRAGMTPVDFRHACCSCGAAGPLGRS